MILLQLLSRVQSVASPVGCYGCGGGRGARPYTLWNLLSATSQL